MKKPIELLLSRLDGVRETPAGWRAFCPHHQRPPHKAGRERTLSLAENHAGGALVRCHGECTTLDIVSAAGLKLSDLFYRPDYASAEEPRVRGIRGWEWWSLASQLDATGDKLMMVVIELADAERNGNLAASRAILAAAVGTLSGLANDIKYGRGISVKTDNKRRSTSGGGMKNG